MLYLLKIIARRAQNILLNGPRTKKIYCYKNQKHALEAHKVKQNKFDKSNYYICRESKEFIDPLGTLIVMMWHTHIG